MPWPIETPPAHSTGLESKTVSGGGDNFSLDFPFYRTGQKWGTRFHFSIETPGIREVRIPNPLAQNRDKGGVSAAIR